MDTKLMKLKEELTGQIEAIPKGRQRYGSKSRGMMSGLGLSSAQMSGPGSVDDKPNSDEKTELDQELEQLGAENEKIQILLEKFDQLQEVMIPDRLAKFKETIDDHLKIFEAKMKKGINAASAAIVSNDDSSSSEE